MPTDIFDEIEASTSKGDIFDDVEKSYLQEEKAKIAAQPEPGFWTGFAQNEKEMLGSLATGAANVVPATLNTIGTTADWLNRNVVDLGTGPGGRPLTSTLGKAAEEQIAKLPQPSDPESFWMAQVPQGLGQMVPMLAGGLAAKGLGATTRGAAMLGSAMGFGQEFDDAYKSSIQRGDDKDTAFFKSLGYASVATGIENLAGAGRIFRQYFPDPVEGVKKLTALGVGKDIIKNFVAGYSEEASQRLAQDLIVEGKPDWQAANREGLVGSWIQGTLTMPSAGIQPGRPDVELPVHQIEVPVGPEPELPPLDLGVFEPPWESVSTADLSRTAEIPGVETPFDLALSRAKKVLPQAAAALEGKPVEKGVQDAVQVEGATALPVRQTPEAGAEVGRQVPGELQGTTEVRAKEAEVTPVAPVVPETSQTAKRIKFLRTQERRESLTKAQRQELVGLEAQESAKEAVELKAFEDQRSKEISADNAKENRDTTLAAMEDNPELSLQSESIAKSPGKVAGLDAKLSDDRKKMDDLWSQIQNLPNASPERNALVDAYDVALTQMTWNKRLRDMVRVHQEATPKLIQPTVEETVPTIKESSTVQEVVSPVAPAAVPADVPKGIETEMLETLKESLTKQREKVSNVRYGSPGNIEFEYDGKTYVSTEPPDVMPAVDAKGTNNEASRSWALKQILQGTAKEKITIPKEVIPNAQEKEGRQVPVTDAGAVAEAAAPSVQPEVKPEAKAKKQTSKQKAKELAKKLDALKSDPSKLGGGLYGVAASVWDGAILIAQKALVAGGTVADAVNAAIAHIKAVHNAVFDEAGARAAIEGELTKPKHEPSPGAKTQPTGSVFLTGDVTKESWDLWDKQANEFIANLTDDQAIEELAKVSAGANTGLSQHAWEFAATELLHRMVPKQFTAKNPVERQRTRESVLRVNEMLRMHGSEGGKVQNARQGAFAKIVDILPIMAYMNQAQKRWLDVLGITNPDKDIKETVDTIVPETNAETAKAINTDAKVKALLMKTAKAEGVNWTDLFLDNPQATQKERREHLFKQIRKRFPDLSPADAIKLEQALSTAWEGVRLRILQQQLQRLIKIPSVRITKEMLPELIRAANAGQLDVSRFREWIADKFNLPNVGGKTAQDLFLLSQEAQRLPQGSRRNAVLAKMTEIIENDSKINKLDLAKDLWYASVLFRAGTWLNVIAGGYATGASWAGLGVAERIAHLSPLQALRTFSQYISGTVEGILAGMEIMKGRYDLLPDYQNRVYHLLSGKGKKFDTLEALKRAGNPIGQLSYGKRFMTALDYITVSATRNMNVYYGAAVRNNEDALLKLQKKFDKAESKRAKDQAKMELGPKASMAEVRIRQREILEEGIDKELLADSLQLGQRAGANADLTQGFSKAIYDAISKWYFFVKAPLGLAFLRSGLNMVNNAVDWMPGVGFVNYTRARLYNKLPPGSTFKKFGLDLPPEQRRLMLSAQIASVGIGYMAWAATRAKDDDDEPVIDFSGGWKNLTVNQKKQLTANGERPWSVGFKIGGKRVWISYRQMPFAPPLAMVGSMRDQERFNNKEWTQESAALHKINGWLNGLLYVKDLSSLSAATALFDWGAGTLQKKTGTQWQMVQRGAASSLGRFASGYIPSILKEIDEFTNTEVYVPERGNTMGYWLRNFPVVRQYASIGPALNMFGEPIQSTKPPFRSWMGTQPDGSVYDVVAKQMNRGIFIPAPGKTITVVDPKSNERRQVTEKEFYQYAKAYGQEAKQIIEDNLEWYGKMTNEEAAKWFGSKVWSNARKRARSSINLEVVDESGESE